ncbi:Hsp20/alpha crystallin family protein [Ketobacter sp. MCCC 1A13808]|jgi:HSP20 family protein|uniref:Hsp20/alpha crystallin family protein n=1 Tax=Ketobacter sp. MCCC 1A13808 TaxID=2602738 RepID=UPI000F2A834F|nr:Hsp20/alpha crystallin family protein [Ketobacter sp. MCCC 1A13808]MVF11228.1 Hsp20/alpha crystallin family protein [Ketobacter sp. MCCC 1A13808]RLP53640.1 MAG: Hsp20/alpha crystallin family protein [Ketobacter sp.]
MSIATLNPWQVLDQLHNDNLRRYGKRNWQPVVDIAESANDYQISLELPGVKPEQVQVELENKVLKISGDKNRLEQEGTAYRYRERAVGTFSRSFRLPEDADKNSVQAKFELGLLNVTIQKQEQLQPRKIEIQVQS